jgi:hypothetical protein
MNKWKENADYGCGSGLEAGLCKLNRQEWWRWLQEQTEMMKNTGAANVASSRPRMLLPPTNAERL